MNARVEAAAQAIAVHTDVIWEVEMATARDALAAADAVMFDEAAMERAAQSLCAAEFPEVSPAYAWNVQFEDGQNHYRQLVRSVVTALQEAST